MVCWWWSRGHGSSTTTAERVTNWLVIFMKTLDFALVVSAVILLGGCALQKTNEAVIAAESVSRFEDPLNIVVTEVKLRKAAISDALLNLSHSVKEAYPDGPRFEVALPLPRDKENERLSREHAPLKYPAITLSASNIRLGELLDRMCAQAHWSYEFGPGFYAFQDIPQRLGRHD